MKRAASSPYLTPKMSCNKNHSCLPAQAVFEYIHPRWTSKSNGWLGWRCKTGQVRRARSCRLQRAANRPLDSRQLVERQVWTAQEHTFRCEHRQRARCAVPLFASTACHQLYDRAKPEWWKPALLFSMRCALEFSTLPSIYSRPNASPSLRQAATSEAQDPSTAAASIIRAPRCQRAQEKTLMNNRGKSRLSPNSISCKSADQDFCLIPFCHRPPARMREDDARLHKQAGLV